MVGDYTRFLRFCSGGSNLKKPGKPGVLQKNSFSNLLGGDHMIFTSIASKKSSSCISCRSSGRYFRAYSVALIALVALAALSLTDRAIAQQGFSLVGTWEQTASTGVQTLTYNRDGTFYGTMAIPPGPNGGSGLSKWWGKYRMRSETSYVAQIQVFQVCATGVPCASCPPGPGEMPGSNACGLAQYVGLVPGVQYDRSFQVQGPSQFVDQFGQTWRRVR